MTSVHLFFFFQAEDGIRDIGVTGVQDVYSSDLLAAVVVEDPVVVAVAAEELVVGVHLGGGAAAVRRLGAAAEGVVAREAVELVRAAVAGQLDRKSVV